jgi:hypothetical protein
MALSPAELAVFEPKTVADEIALARVQGAKGKRGLAETVEITDRTEGKAPQTINVNDVNELERLVIRVQERVLAQTGRELARDLALEHVLAYRPDLAQLR